MAAHPTRPPGGAPAEAAVTDDAPVPTGLDHLSRQQRQELLALLAERDRRDARGLFDHLFPDAPHMWRGETFHGRDRYPKHMEFFAATATATYVAFMAANRVGKTVTGGYFTAAAATGRYPPWWTGRRWDRPVRIWAAGKSNATVRTILQTKLLGRTVHEGARKSVDGTGIVPGDSIGRITWKAGLTDAVDTVRIRHLSGRWSVIDFKSYEQGRGAFEGAEQDIIWLDEEPPIDIWNECAVRVMTTGGVLIGTFTPLDGITDTVLLFLPGARPDA
ncbi:terminase large subunit domain-containing protein [Eilatimonas milleporae]|uniref:Phage terminase large subunit-like protein n=1 Tax=Eilatimonas milleporae TaxID=911205 RepID=A0A3M0CSQ4_9PROT|nr:terminase family protein [Eilatimonas milleporae]RMB11915.1 phage terminase large subunit-like protein [Eilatimonas milleporae]